MDITALVALGTVWTFTCEDGRNVFRATEEEARVDAAVYETAANCLVRAM